MRRAKGCEALCFRVAHGAYPPPANVEESGERRPRDGRDFEVGKHQWPDSLWKDPSEDAGSPSTAHASRKRKGEMLENVWVADLGGALYPLQLRTLQRGRH